MPDPILVAKAKSEIFLLPQFANRHGLIAAGTNCTAQKRMIRSVPGSLLGGGTRR